MHNIRLFWSIVKKCNFQKFFLGFLVAFFLGALLIQAFEPGISRLGDALWYLFVSCTTIGFGDMTTITFVGRMITVIITCYEIILVALLSGVIVSHYIEVIHRREEFTATVLLDKLEHLTELSQQELQEIQDRARKIGREFDRRAAAKANAGPPPNTNREAMMSMKQNAKASNAADAKTSEDVGGESQ